MNQILFFLFLFGNIFFISTYTHSQESKNEKHIKVVLRMIGHQILLNTGDSTSLVLPIIEEKGRYRIQFDTEFEIQPEDLVAIIDQVVNEAKLAESYILEVEECGSKEIVYSFEMNQSEEENIVPCKSRSLPKACYSLLVTLLEKTESDQSLIKENTSIESNSNQSKILIGFCLILVVLAAIFLWKRKKKATINPNLISLVKYLFDKLNTELLYEGQKIELTSKEADLLLLLYTDVNTTVERDVILNLIWGDEGDYVGRTLDVFISKLRKKLELDSKVKIVNIRGVGYKLVLDV